MGVFKNLCKDIAAIPKILTFSDIANAAARGALCWENTPGGAWVGAILGVSAEASKRVHDISLDLMTNCSHHHGKDGDYALPSPPRPGKN